MRTKEEIVSAFNEMYVNSDYVLVVDYKGMNATDTACFRGDLKLKCGVKFFVIKNTLNNKSSAGTAYENCIHLGGQCGVIYCNDILNVSKVVNEYCFKNNKAKFVGCFNRGEQVTEESIKEMASLPSIEVLRTKLLYLFNSVGSSLVRAMAEKVKKEGGDVTE